jgi:hypothetical protein
MMTRARKPLAAKVKKIIQSLEPREPEQADVRIETRRSPNEKIPIENRPTDENGNQARLKYAS